MMHEGFKEDCEGYLNDRVKGWQRYGFETLYHDVLNVSGMEEGQRMTITAKSCLSILNSEREKQRRRDEWTRKQKNK